MHLADQVRTHCRAVMATARLVTINQDKIADYALGLPEAQIFVPSYALPRDGAAQDRELEAARVLVLALDAINFGSGWHDVIAKRPGHSGARSMARALTDFAETGGPLNAEKLALMNTGKCVAIFAQDPANEQAAELMGLFARAFGELGEFLSRHGSAGTVIGRSEGSAVRLAELLTEMPMFRDVGYYKRAQIAAADLARESLAEFDDLAELTAFADNLVPHVLWVDGVITLDNSLSAAITSRELLVPGGLAERELRAGAVHVVEMLCAERPDLTAMDIDLALWERGGGESYKSRPRPRCRSFYY